MRLRHRVRATMAAREPACLCHLPINDERIPGIIARSVLMRSRRWLYNYRHTQLLYRRTADPEQLWVITERDREVPRVVVLVIVREKQVHVGCRCGGGRVQAESLVIVLGVQLAVIARRECPIASEPVAHVHIDRLEVLGDLWQVEGGRGCVLRGGASNR